MICHSSRYERELYEREGCRCDREYHDFSLQGWTPGKLLALTVNEECPYHGEGQT